MLKKKVLLILLCLGLIWCTGVHAQDDMLKNKNVMHAEFLKKTPLVMIIVDNDGRMVRTKENFDAFQQRSQELMTEYEWKRWGQRHEVHVVNNEMSMAWDRAVTYSEEYFSENNEDFSSNSIIVTRKIFRYEGEKDITFL